MDGGLDYSLYDLLCDTAKAVYSGHLCLRARSLGLSDLRSEATVPLSSPAASYAQS